MPNKVVFILQVQFKPFFVMETEEEKCEKCVDAEPSQETDNETDNAKSLQEKGKVFQHLDTDLWVVAY